MTDPEEKKIKQPETDTKESPVKKPTAIRDESRIYGDEGELPLRRHKKSASASSKKKKKKPIRKVHRRPKKSLLEILSASGEDSYFKPLYIFGFKLKFWPLILLAVIVLMTAGVVLNNGNVETVTQNVTVVGLPDEMEDYKIAVLSDMNARRFGDEQYLLLRELNNNSYDLIFCVGDMVGSSGDPEPFYEFLDGLKNPSKVYFICGDSDPGPFVKKVRAITGTLEQMVLEDWILGAMERGAHYVDAPTCIALKNTNLWVSPATMLNLEGVETLAIWEDQMRQEEEGTISGIGSDYASLPLTSYRYNQMLRLYNAQKQMSSTDIHIALAHEPPEDNFIYTAEERHDAEGRYLLEPELIVAGHFCGGNWKLPVLGAFYVPDDTLPRHGWFPEQKYVSGLREDGDTQIYVDGGLSANKDVRLMPFRLFNQPELTVLTLTSKLPGNLFAAD